MRIKINIGLLLIVSASLLSCGDAANVKEVPVVEIKGELCPVEFNSAFVLPYCFDSVLLAVTCVETPLFRAYKNNEEVYRYGAIGRGPNEFLSIMPTSVLGDTLLVNDSPLNSLIYLKVGDDGDGQYIKEVKRETYKAFYNEKENIHKSLSDVVKVNDKYFVGTAMWSDTSLFGLCDSKMNLIRYFGSLPIKTGLDVMSLMTDFNGLLQSRNDKVVFAMLNFAYLSVYSIADDGAVEKDWEDEIFPMHFEIKNGGMKLSRDRAFGKCRWLHLSEKYIYLLVQETLCWDDYDGKVDSQVHPNSIYVYDYDGNRLVKLITDRGVTSFFVDENDSQILGITAYDTKLVRYDISQITSKLEEN